VNKEKAWQNFESDYSGYIGIAPWTANPDEKEKNFMWQLKQAGLIDHMTVSFFVHLDDAMYPNSPSTIKFGSWDPINIKNGELVSIIRTADATSWDIKASFFKLDKEDDGLDFDAFIRLDPGLPYLYVPKAIYDEFTKFIEKKYHAGVCHPEVNICKFDFSCKKIAETFGKNADF